MVLIRGQQTNFGLTLVLLRGQRKNICVIVVLLMGQLTTIGFRMVLLSGQQKHIRCITLAMEYAQKHSFYIVCHLNTNKSIGFISFAIGINKTNIDLNPFAIRTNIGFTHVAVAFINDTLLLYHLPFEYK